MGMENAAMWRVKYGKGNASGGGSGGDWAYYERDGFELLEADLLEALLNGDCGDGNRYQRGARLLSKVLRRHRRPDLDADSNTWRRHKVIEVAYLDGDEWVPVTVTWTPPTVVLGDPGDS